jgi:hypothetical protein
MLARSVQTPNATSSGLIKTQSAKVILQGAARPDGTDNGRVDQRSPENGSDKMSATEVGGRTDMRMLGGRFSVLSTEP